MTTAAYKKVPPPLSLSSSYLVEVPNPHFVTDPLRNAPTFTPIQPDEVVGGEAKYIHDLVLKRKKERLSKVIYPGFNILKCLI